MTHRIPYTEAEKLYPDIFGEPLSDERFPCDLVEDPTGGLAIDGKKYRIEYTCPYCGADVGAETVCPECGIDAEYTFVRGSLEGAYDEAQKWVEDNWGGADVEYLSRRNKYGRWVVAVRRIEAAKVKDSDLSDLFGLDIYRDTHGNLLVKHVDGSEHEVEYKKFAVVGVVHSLQYKGYEHGVSASFNVSTDGIQYEHDPILTVLTNASEVEGWAKEYME